MHTPYQMFVLTAGSAATDVEARVTGVAELIGIPAKLVAGMLILDCAVIGPAPKPLSPSTRQPQVLTLSERGLAAVPDSVPMLLVRYFSEASVLVFAIVNTYPPVLYV